MSPSKNKRQIVEEWWPWVTGKSAYWDDHGSIESVTSEEFLERCARGETNFEKGILVIGNLDLRKHPLKNKIKKLPRAMVKGSLFADDTCVLEECECNFEGDVMVDRSSLARFGAKEGLLAKVQGIFCARLCSNLSVVRGFFNKDVHLEESGVEEVGRDFACQGGLYVGGCAKLKTLNCQAGIIHAENSGVAEIGPDLEARFFCADFCPNLKKVGAIKGLSWAGFSHSGIQEIAKDFQCAGPVKLLHCPHLKSISGKMRRVDITGASTIERVEDLRAGEIFFHLCQELPSTFTKVDVVSLTFQQCGIARIPSGIPVGAHVTISQCGRYSEVPRHWKGDLQLIGLDSLREVPSSFRCEGSLSVEDCENLSILSGEVKKDLNLMSGCVKLKNLGRELFVGGKLRICPASKVEHLDCRVGGTVYAMGCQVRQTGDDFWVEGMANFRSCKRINSLSGRVKGDTMLDESSIVSLGADFECEGRISLRDTKKLQVLNCVAGGDVHVAYSSLAKTGPAFHGKKWLYIEKCPKLRALGGRVDGDIRVDAGLGGSLLEEARGMLEGRKRLNKIAEKIGRPKESMPKVTRGARKKVVI